MKIILDIDDVLADTVAALERRLGPAADLSAEHLNEMFPYAELNLVIESVDFHLQIPPLKGAVEGVHRLIGARHEVLYATSRPSDMELPTRDWLAARRFPELPLHCSGRDAKKVLLRTWDYDLLVDDQIRYLSIARERDLRSVALAYPWNAQWSGTRVQTWDEIEEYAS